jgi:hypothetical protein
MTRDVARQPDGGVTQSLSHAGTQDSHVTKETKDMEGTEEMEETEDKQTQEKDDSYDLRALINANAVAAARVLLEELEAEPEDERQEWQFMFRLARRLRALEGIDPDDVEVMRDAVEAFCLEMPEWAAFYRDFADVEDGWLAFVQAWFTVHTPEGQGPLERALAFADQDPVEVPRTYGIATYQRFVSMLFHLQRIRGTDPMILPVERIGQRLDRDKMHAWRLIERAKRDGLIDLVEPHSPRRSAATYSFNFNCEAYEPPPGYERGLD